MMPKVREQTAVRAVSDGDLAASVQQALEDARKLGATAAEASATAGHGFSVTARLGETETVEHHRDKDLSITVYFNDRTGSATTSDLSPDAVRETVRAASVIARYTAPDPCAGLADRDRMAWEVPDLALYRPWGISLEQAIDLAIRCEDAARSFDRRVSNSEGATVSTHAGSEVYGNTHGFLGTVRATRHGVSCSVIGQDGIGMQRDYWYTAARDPDELEDAVAVGRRAAERVVRRLGARKIATQQADVVFEAPVAGSLLSHFVSAARGSSLYRNASFLVGALGKPLFAPHVDLVEHPHLPGRLGSAPFDDEGVATAERTIVSEGRLEGYFLDSYAARKLGLATTGNAGGTHNLTLSTGGRSLDELVRAMGRGLLVTELIGFGVNIVTGDYSRGAAGFWVEHGEIQYPVEEITIAGNLRDMFRNLAEVANDVDVRGTLLTGSIWIPGMMIAGS
ncbi:MAG: metalloprotease PmbA [Acidiferrobacteraceae bacterium]